MFDFIKNIKKTLNKPKDKQKKKPNVRASGSGVQTSRSDIYIKLKQSNTRQQKRYLDLIKNTQ